jgi:WD40 repeat protein
VRYCVFDIKFYYVSALNKVILMCYSKFCRHCLCNSVADEDRHVTSAMLKHNFIVKQLICRKCSVAVLSVSSDGQLLVGGYTDRQLLVYSTEGNHVTSVNLLDGETLKNAVWTPRGNIAYTSDNTNNVVVMTRRGDVIAQTKSLFGIRLSVFTDDVIYLADYRTGVYQSTDDGVTWSHVFKVADGWDCIQVTKVSCDSIKQVFWTIEKLKADNENWRLQVYTVNKQRASNNVTGHDVTLPLFVTVNLQYSKLAYDGLTNVFVTDVYSKAVHVWSVSDRQYLWQLVSSDQLVGSPWSIAVDSLRGNVMYVGQDEGTVGVFELMNEYVSL